MRVNIKSNTILSGEDVRNVIDDLARKGIYTKKIVCYFNCVDSDGKYVYTIRSDSAWCDVLLSHSSSIGLEFSLSDDGENYFVREKNSEL